MDRADIFSVILLIARPAAGKSEIIEYLSNQVDDRARQQDYHLGMFNVIDDFPFLWRWFEEDELLERMGKTRLFTDQDGYFREPYYWDLLIHLINLEYEKSLRDAEIEGNCTTVLEFSRGKQHGGYRQALAQLSDNILQQLAILYVDVPWEESLRKNRLRFNPDRPDSILAHSLPDDKLERLYRDCDFCEIAHGNQGFIPVKGHEIPFVVFYNFDDVTTKMGPELGKRLKISLGSLWQLSHQKG